MVCDLYNAGSIDEMFDGSEPTYFSELRSDLGKLETSTSSGVEATTSSSGPFVESGYVSTLERGTAIEHFRWQVVDGEATLMGYYIDQILIDEGPTGPGA